MNDTRETLPCESFEVSLSALIDGELEPPEQLPAIDHLLECSSCRAFYKNARVLGDMVTSAQAQGAEAAPEELWHRIAAESGVSGEGRKRSWRELRRFPRWTLQLAAAVLLGVGLWWIRPDAPGPASVPPAGEETFLEDASGEEDGEEDGDVDVILEEDRGSMTEERFVALTTEILRADRRYHRKMFEVMSVVTAMTQRPEGSTDEPSIAVTDSSRRISLGEDEGDGDLVWSGDRL